MQSTQMWRHIWTGTFTAWKSRRCVSIVLWGMQPQLTSIYAHPCRLATGSGSPYLSINLNKEFTSFRCPPKALTRGSSLQRYDLVNAKLNCRCFCRCLTPQRTNPDWPILEDACGHSRWREVGICSEAKQMTFSPYLLRDEPNNKTQPSLPSPTKNYTRERYMIYCYFINNVAYNFFK